MPYKSFKEALAAQKSLVEHSKKPGSLKVVSEGRQRSSRSARPASSERQERVEDYIPVADARTESIIASRLRR